MIVFHLLLLSLCCYLVCGFEFLSCSKSCFMLFVGEGGTDVLR